MEEKKITTSFINRDTCVSKHLLFDWQIKEEKQNKFSSTIIFVRDNEKPYINELKKLEFSYKEYKFIPFIYVIILISLAVISFTTFLVLFLIHKENLAEIMWSLIFVIFGALALLGGVAILYSRNKTSERISIDKPKQDREIKEKIKNIKEQYR